MTPDPEHADPAPGFHMLAKPGGSSCNIDCSDCFFLSKEALYPDRRQHMSDQTLETYIRQLLQAHTSTQVQVAWQGGEPTLMQLPFFARAVELVEQCRRPDQVVEHSIQTNGTLIDEDWCRFLKQHRFLVGLSVDGSRALHDRHRVDRLGQDTFVQPKRSALPVSCLQCAVRPWCHSGCPKDRFVRSADADQATNYLCDGYRLFFWHIQPALRQMVERPQLGRPPADVMAWKARQDADGGPYQPCSCGSGHKLRFCHGNRALPSPFQGAGQGRA